MLKGIDISIWQRDNYKAQIDQFGQDFVIVRAGFSKTVDSMCDTFYQYAKSKGKKLGFYFFPLTSDGTPEECAKWAYNQVTGYIGEAIPILDWEAYQTNSVHNVADVNWAKRWLDEFTRLSEVKPIIYMNSSCEASYDWSAVVKADYGLWIANYGANDGINHGTPKTKHWGTVALHQYTSLLDGRSLDGDVFNGNAAAWGAYCGSKNKQGNTVPTAKPEVVTPSKKSDEEIAKEVIAGKWGNGDDRIKRLTNAGYNFTTVQNIVNNMLTKTNPYSTYTVKAGDNLSAIATKYGTTYQKIAADNKIQNANLIYPDMVLKIYK